MHMHDIEPIGRQEQPSPPPSSSPPTAGSLILPKQANQWPAGAIDRQPVDIDHELSMIRLPS